MAQRGRHQPSQQERSRGLYSGPHLLSYLVLYVKAAASWGASDRALFGLNVLTYVTAAVMVAGLTPLRFPDDWYPQYPDPFSEPWTGDNNEDESA